jgi:hypothetical protein
MLARMGPWDGVDVDSDGGELLDWLWDFPERYDVGIADEPLPAGGAVGTSPSGVRKHLRLGGAALAVGAARPEALVDDRPTVAMDSIDADDYEEDGSEYPPTGFIPLRRRRVSARNLAAAAAVIVVVAAGVGIGYTLFKGKGTSSGKPNNLAISTPSTTLATQSVIPPADTTPTSSDTTTSIPATTLPSSSSVPGIIPAASTTTTTGRCTLNCTTTTVARTTTTVPKTSTTIPSPTSTVRATTTTTAPTKVTISLPPPAP